MSRMPPNVVDLFDGTQKTVLSDPEELNSEEL